MRHGGVISFSEAPLRLGIWIGLVLVMVGFAYAIVAGVISIVSWELRPRGFATLVIALSFLSGIQLVVISLLGEYIIRIFKETKQRPLYVVKEAWNVELPPEDETLGVVASSSLGGDEEKRGAQGGALEEEALAAAMTAGALTPLVEARAGEAHR